MAAIVLDTNILIDYVKGYASWIDDILESPNAGSELVLPTIVIAEYFASNALDDKKEVAIVDKTFALFKKQELTEDIAKELGGLLRHKSYPSGASIADLIIAATALCLHAPLATRNNAHFRGIPNLTFFDLITIQPA